MQTITNKNECNGKIRKRKEKKLHKSGKCTDKFGQWYDNQKDETKTLTMIWTVIKKYKKKNIFYAFPQDVVCKLNQITHVTFKPWEE